MKKLHSIIAALCICLCAGATYAAEVTPLPEEVVTGQSEREDTQLLSPGTVSVVKPEEMQGEQKSLPELLKQVPGLHVIESKGRGAYTVASVRGSTAAEVSVFVDGVLMNLGSEAAVDLSTIPVDNVERIEVYRGYVPARFAGASMGGVINVITKKPDKPGGSLSLGVGSYGKFKTNLSYVSPLGGGKFFFGANYERTDGDFEYLNDNNSPYTPGDDYRTKRQNNGYKNTDFLAKWNDDDWALRLGWKRNDRELPYGAPAADRPWSLPGAHLDTDQFDFSASRRFKSGGLDWGVKAHYLRSNKVYNDPNDVIGGWWESRNEYTTSRYGIALDGSYALGKNHLIEFLGDYAKERLDVDGDIITTYGGITEFNREAANAQIQDTINLDKSGSLTFTPIVRWNMWDGEGKFSWGAAIGKDLGGGWSVKASGGTYNRAPNLYELYGDGAFVRPNQDLKWEDGTQWDVGVTWKEKIKKADIMATASYFGRRSNNLIEFFMVSPRSGRYFNVGDALIHGLELEGSAVWDKWDAKFSATWMSAKNMTDDYRKDKPLPNRPKYEGSLRVSRKFLKDDAAAAFAELRYIGENYYDYTGSVRMDDILTLGLGLRWKFSDNMKVVVGVDDIFDKSPETLMYAVYNGPSSTMWYPLQGRTFYATLTWDF
ncbi:TonB-dependent receptor plug domain-containing protein [Cloacibacillus evryensis]|uniref:TonB-dependent receptor plug domain-containing protein n=1 Tax=Cloacibacillus evryensis TaxID=508460 RepID=UPI003AB1A677